VGSRLSHPSRRHLVADLNRMPALSAAGIVVGCALATMLAMALLDAAFGGGGDAAQPSVRRSAAAPQRANRSPDLGNSRYPHARGSGAAPPPAQSPPDPAEARTPMRRLVGEKLMVRMSGTSPSPGLLSRVRRGHVGGVVLFADNIGTKADLRSLTAQLQAASRAGGGSGVLIAIDQEGGIVKRLGSAPPTRSAPQMGVIGSTAIAQQEGGATGAYLHGLGVNVDFAPVADTASVPSAFIANRTFGREPSKVGALATSFATGLQNQGVAATAKHFPGLGSATTNTDDGRSVIPATRASLDRQARPFEDTVRGGIQLVMTSTAVYPALDPGVPAALSRKIVTDRLRQGLQFQGLIVTDDLETPAVRSYTPTADAAVRAAAAGNDLVLLARSEGASRAAYETMLAAARDGRLQRAELEGSHARIQQLLGAMQP
jgi:beta-N-acetylhexosaminidase